MRTKRTFTRIFFIIFISLFLANCRNQEGTPEPESPHPEHVNFFHYFSGTLSGGIDEMIADVNDQLSEDRILANALDHEAYKSMIHTALESGNPPELFSYWAGARVQQLVDRKQIFPIDDVWEEQNLTPNFTKAIIDSAVTYNGEKYLLPITQHIVVFFYNRKIFDSLDLNSPKTWQDFKVVIDRLQKEDIAPIALGAREKWPAQFWFDYLLLRTAGPEYRHELMRGEASYVDDEVMRTYSMWAELIKNGDFNADANQLGWAEATKLVCEGKAAMTLMGTWALQMFEDKECGFKAGEDFGFFPFPVIESAVAKVSVGPIDGLILSRAAENKEFAKKVLAYFAGKHAQEVMSKGSGALAPNIKVPKSFYSPFKQQLMMEVEASDQWAFNYDLATPTQVAEKGMDSFNELIEFPDQYEVILQNLQTELDQIQESGSSR